MPLTQVQMHKLHHKRNQTASQPAVNNTKNKATEESGTVMLILSDASTVTVADAELLEGIINTQTETYKCY